MTPSQIRLELTELARREHILEGDLPEGDLSEHLDSVQRLTLVVAIEDHFEVIFEPEDDDGIETIDQVVALVARKLTEKETTTGADGGQP